MVNLRGAHKPGKLPNDGIDRVGLLVDGNLHSMIGVMAPQIGPFRLGDARHGALPAPGAPGPLLPRGLLKARLAEMMTATVTRLGDLARLYADRPVVVLNAPPPPEILPSAEALRLRSKRHEGVSDLSGLRDMPARLRLEIHAVQSEIYRETARALGMAWLPPPGAALTPDGYLRPDLWDEDPTHANARYGALYLDALEAFFAAHSPEPAGVS